MNFIFDDIKFLVAFVASLIIAIITILLYDKGIVSIKYTQSALTEYFQNETDYSKMARQIVAEFKENQIKQKKVERSLEPDKI